MQSYADCSFCKGKVIENKVQKACWLGGKLRALIDSVPAGVCTQCGEQYYTAVVLKRIEALMEKKESFTTICIPTREFAETVVK